MKIAFDPPLKHDGRSLAEMVLREPTGGEVLAAEKAIVDVTGGHVRRLRDGTLIAAVSGAPVELVRMMPAGKFKAAAAFLNAFGAPSAEDVRSTELELVIPLPARIDKVGRLVDQLELREPTTGEVEEAQRQLTDGTTAAMRKMQIHLIAMVADLPRPVIEAVPITQLNQASRYLMGFT